MRQIRNVLKLHYEKQLSQRQVARACDIGNGTVAECLRRAREVGLGWPLPENLNDESLEQLLYPPAAAERDRTRPDCAWIHRELSRPGVTLQLLWVEYRQDHSSGYGYSRFCELYQRYRKKLHPIMRQVHRAGEKTFLDFSGKKPSIVDPKTGEIREVELFVGVLGASHYFYAEATPSQELHHWIAAHLRMFAYFGGVSALLVPDNLKSAVTDARRYEPGVNRTYEEMAQHYGAAVVPARPYKPRDKAKVEACVLIAQRWILAALRNRTFFSLAELNEAIWELLPVLNARPLQKLGVSRRELFEQIDRPALRPLPDRPYEIGTWMRCRVNLDYHIEVEKNYYSVPHELLHEQVEARVTDSIVEIFRKNVRVASHRRLTGKWGHSTQPAHMPRSHREHAEWNPSRILQWAEKSGLSTAQLVSHLLESRLHPEQAYRSCRGLLRLGEHYGKKRLEAACTMALRLQSHSYKTVQNILSSGMDRCPPEAPDTTTALPEHANIRGASYYQMSDPVSQS